MIEKGTSGLKAAERFHRQRNKPACVPALRINRRRNCSCGRDGMGGKIKMDSINKKGVYIYEIYK